MYQKKKVIIVLLAIFAILVGVIGYLTRYHFLPIDYLTKKAEDSCIVMNDNDADKAKECVCRFRSTLLIIPEQEVRPLILKTINKDKIGIKRILASHVTFMNAMVAANEYDECNNSRIRFHNGVVKIYHPNGKIAQEQLWNDDKLTHVVLYYDNGKIESESHTLDVDEEKNSLIRHGAYKTYYKNGQLKEEGYYNKNVVEGTVVAYFENGSLQSEAIFKNGKADGLMKFYYENGNIKEESNMKYGERNGICKGYRDDGTLLSETNYKNGKLDGLNKRFYGDGSLCKRMWKNDKRQSQICYDKEGKKINLNSLIKFYHKNGKIESESNYINGKAEGISRIYYTNGNLEEEAVWKNDQLNGEMKQYDISGKLKAVLTYKNGEVVK